MKSEPSTYSIDHMKTEGNCIWDGVRNYQARNFLRRMAVGDLAFFYHSNTKHPGIVGLIKISETNLDDPTQFDSASDYYDPKSTPEAPRWQTVRVEFIEEFSKMLTLADLKQKFTADDLLLVRRGSRLSVMPVAEEIADKILKLVREINDSVG